MPDGTVLVVELKRGRITRVHPDGRKETVAEPGGSPNGLAIGPDGALYVCNSGGWDFFEIGDFTIPAHRAARAPHRRPHRAHRPRDRRREGALHRVRRQPADRTERHRVRRARRHVVHRSRPPRGPGAARRRDLLRAARRLVDPRGRVPVGVAERHRPLTRRHAAVRGRDPHRPRVRVERHRARARSSATRRARPARCSAGSPACSSSTRSASTATATSWSRRSSPAALTVISPGGEVLDQVLARRPDGHQRVLRRRRPAHRVRHLLGDRPAGDRSRGPAPASKLNY